MQYPATWSGICALSDEVVFVKGTLVALDAKVKPHALILRRSRESWKPILLWQGVVAHCVIMGDGWEYFGLSPFGRVTRITASGESVELVRSATDTHGWLLGLHASGNGMWAVGMGRRAYFRELEGNWKEASPSQEPKEGSDDLEVGFRAVYAQDDVVCAVGFKGEIWWRSNGRWGQLQSPTNATLHAVLVANNGCVFACGANGVLVYGRPEHLTAFRPEGEVNDLWSIAEFRGVVYASSSSAVYQIGMNGTTRKIESPPGGACSYLCATNDSLWSVGSSVIAKWNGESWQELELPTPPPGS